MGMNSFEKLRLGLTGGMMGSALLLAGGAVSRVQAAETRPSQRGGSSVTVTRTGFFWFISNSTSTEGITGLGIREASATTSVQTTGGSSTTLSDAFDGCEVMAVDGTSYADPDGTLDLVGDSVIGDPTVIAGLEVSREFSWTNSALPNGTAIMRSLNTFTNNGASPVSVTVSFGCNLGSDGSTFIEGTSNGSGNVTVTDDNLWFVSSDEQPYSDPPVTHVRFGTGASVVPFFGSLGPGPQGVNPGAPGPGDDNYVDNYDISVDPGQTVHILRYLGLSNGGLASLSDAPTFEDLDSLDAAGLLAGIPASAQENIVNFAMAGPAPSPFAVPTMSRFGLILMAGLLALGGLLGWRRMTQ